MCTALAVPWLTHTAMARSPGLRPGSNMHRCSEILRIVHVRCANARKPARFHKLTLRTRITRGQVIHTVVVIKQLITDEICSIYFGSGEAWTTISDIPDTMAIRPKYV